MTVLMSNTYVYDKEEGTQEHVVTGLVGVFEDRAKAMPVWNDNLKTIGVPDEVAETLDPKDTTYHAFVSLDENGKYTDDVEKCEFIIELMIKDTELNKILKPGD